MKSHHVFGISNSVQNPSYVDRGDLDDQLKRHLDRTTHVALRGESKAGKSWLRQQNIPNHLTVQCRLEKSALTLFEDALSQLQISLVLERTQSRSLKGEAKATGEIGIKLLASLEVEGTLGGDLSSSTASRNAGHTVNDLRFVADIIKASGRRLVIEDFHYLSADERKRFAFDLKTLWDYGLFVVIIGVWSRSNMLLHLNPDLSGRVHEIAVTWTTQELGEVLVKGGNALNIEFSPRVRAVLASDCFGSVGVLQKLTLDLLDILGIGERLQERRIIDDTNALQTAALEYAEQLVPLYQQFAANVSSGIRTRKDSTGIYAHAMAAILEASDAELIDGVSVDWIYDVAHARQPRIQKGNLRVVLEKFDGLQVDSDGRGLVLAFNEATDKVTVVDKQLLLYRKYSTVNWPWARLIEEADNNRV